MNKDLLVSNIINQCERVGTKPTPACIEAGVGKDLIQNIRLGKKTELWRIADLAAYLGCSTSDLVGDAASSELLLSELTLRLGEVWERLDETDRAQLVGFARGLAAAEKYTQTTRSDRQTAG